MNDSKYRKTERWLYNLKALKERIKNLELQIEEKRAEAEGQGIDYSMDKLSATYKFNSETENIAVEIADLEHKKKSYENRVMMLENSLNILNDTERTIIRLKYFDNEPWWSIGYKVKYSERQCRYIRTAAVEKLSVALFGE